jgi:hypothetical protein
MNTNSGECPLKTPNKPADAATEAGDLLFRLLFLKMATSIVPLCFPAAIRSANFGV